MKLYSNNIDKLFAIIANNQTGAILFHGPNQGFIQVIIQRMIDKFNLIPYSPEAKEINLASLESMAMARNFLGQRELIKISDTGNSTLDKDIKNFLTNRQFDNLICFIGDESLPPLGIRKFFEEQPNLVSVGCYYDNEEVIAKMFLDECEKNGKSVENDALVYLKRRLRGDYLIVRDEINKILTYTHDKNIITREDLEKTLPADIMSSGDEMCIYFAKNRPLEWLNEVNKLLGQNINQVLIIRALIRYYTNLYIVCSKIEDNENIDNAIKSLSPPIFFKYVNDFRQICLKINSADTVKALSVLQKAEVSYKNSPDTFDFMNQIYLPYFGA